MEHLSINLNGSKREDVSGGSHTENFIIEIEGKEHLAKVVGLSGKEDQFATLSQAAEMSLQVEKYHDALEQYGINVPYNQGYLITRLEGRPCIIEVVPYMGNALSRRLMTNLDWQAWSPWIDQILGDIGKLIDESRPLALLPVGIDPKPSNYVVTEQDDLCYVDLIWPLRRESLDQMVHRTIQPVWKFRYFHPVGILLNLVVQTTRIHLPYRRQIIETVLGFSRRYPKLHDYLAKIPGFYSDISTLRPEIIGLIKNYRIDILRDLGLELIFRLDRPEEIDSIFEQTRTNPRLTFPEDRVATVKPYLGTLLTRLQSH